MSTAKEILKLLNSEKVDKVDWNTRNLLEAVAKSANEDFHKWVWAFVALNVFYIGILITIWTFGLSTHGTLIYDLTMMKRGM